MEALDQRWQRRQGARRRAVLVGAMVVALLIAAPPAFADGGTESTEAHELVQQAIANMTNNPGDVQIEIAMEKVGDALETSDQEGVNVAQLEQAQAVLESGDVEQARSLLQDSISEAMSARAPAVGEETGTTIVHDALPGRVGLAGVDMGFLIASIVLLVVGVALSWRFRPRESVSTLRARLTRPDSTPIDEKSPKATEEAK